jgi:acetyl esterase/lipase
LKAYVLLGSWIKVAVVLMGLSSLIGCASKPQPIAAQAVLASHPLATRTAASSLTLVPATTPAVPTAIPSSTPWSTSSEAAATVEPGSVPAVALGQFPYSTSLQVVDDDGVTRTINVNFLLYLPGDYGQDPQRHWPLILFLHGASERGYNPLDITRYSIPAFLTARSDFPFIVLSPQSLPDNWWSNQVDMLNALLDQIQTDYAVDPKRIYLTGQSMGGFGTWALAL